MLECRLDGIRRESKQKQTTRFKEGKGLCLALDDQREGDGLMQRRVFCAGGATAIIFPKPGLARQRDFPPIRAVTTGPKFHWRGYYDKLLFDADDRFLLANQVDFEGRTPEPRDRIQVGMIDLANRDEWIEIGSSVAWNWQQGCMLQWIPGTEAANQMVLWNDRIDFEFVSHLWHLGTKKVVKTLPMPIYCIAPNGRWGLSVDFRRLNDCRPGYGYAGIPDPYVQSSAPDDTGIWHVDFETGKTKFLLSYAQIAKLEYRDDVKLQYDPKKSKHWFNHLLISPDGNRFLFLHRWREFPAGATRADLQKLGFSTRMLTANIDGSDLHVMDPFGKTSHFIWRDASHVCAWAWHPSHKDRFYLFEDRTEKVEGVGVDVMTENGHNTYLPNRQNDWILNDTYPNRERLQRPYLFQVSSNKKFPIAELHSPQHYLAEFRCDNHPCASRRGRLISVDSPHGGNGRQVYVIDISEWLS